MSAHLRRTLVLHHPESADFLFGCVMEIISKSEAKSLGLKRYFNGKVCKNGEVAERLTSTSNCLCHKCREVKNAQNNAYYHSVKNEEWFVSSGKERRREKAAEKSEYDRQYREENRERLAKITREWARKNPDKVKAIKHSYKARRRHKEASGASTQELSEWAICQKKVCYWCLEKCDGEYHIDHYVPLSKGGKHEIDNLVIACPTCNIRKNAKDPYEYANSLGRLF